MEDCEVLLGWEREMRVKAVGWKKVSGLSLGGIGSRHD
jgi:hypothetical protein